jgi:hypothetical protein
MSRWKSLLQPMLLANPSFHTPCRARGSGESAREPAMVR